KPGIHLVFMPSLQKSLAQYDEDLRNELVKEFCLPDFFFRHMGWDANGFFGSVDIPYQTHSDRGYRGCGTFSRFLSKQLHHENASVDSSEYTWNYMGFSTLWLKHSDTEHENEVIPGNSPLSNETHIMLCFDLEENIAKKLICAFDQTDVVESQNEPFFLLKVALGTVVEQFEGDLDSFRNPVRKIEKERSFFLSANGSDSKEEFDEVKFEQLAERYATLHEVSRHILHISETLGAASNNMTAIIQDHKLWMRSLQLPSTLPNNTARALWLYSNIFSNLKLRADAFVGRMDNEIKCVGVQSLRCG
ncbi:hypothetical protein N7490_003198, partial [Penicillium lividum]